MTPEQVEAWKAAGITKAIVGAGYHDPAVQQIRACADGGLAVEVYRYLFWGRPMHEQVEFALSIIEDSRIQVGRLWLDAEDAVIWSVDDMLVKLIEAKRTADKYMPLGVYTRRDWWERHLANTADFGCLPLWYASYDGLPNFAGFQRFGGWHRPAMKQYEQNVILAGRNVDLNAY